MTKPYQITPASAAPRWRELERGALPHPFALALLALLAGAVSCERATSAPAPKVLAGADESTAPEFRYIGVDPDDFDCESVAPAEEVRSALGYDFTTLKAAFKPPAGVPPPCQYVGKTEDRPTWSFDIDCRDRALDDASALMVKYAGAAEARAVMVGRSGLDHSGSSLLFIDDDSPCYVRVLGPDAEGRLALAHLVAERLTERNAPAGQVLSTVE